MGYRPYFERLQGITFDQFWEASVLIVVGYIEGTDKKFEKIEFVLICVAHYGPI